MNTMGTSDERYIFLGGLTLKEWFDSPEGEASVRDLKETRERDRRFKQRFAERVKSMAVEEQDRWMAKISASTKRRLEAEVGEFISENGVKIGEAECGDIFQYNHWKAIQILGCYRFEYTDKEAHEYGHDVFYEIKLMHVWDSPTMCIDGVPVCVDNAYFKTRYEANKYGEWFVLESKKRYEGISGFIKGEYKIKKIKLSTIEVKINQTKENWRETL